MKLCDGLLYGLGFRVIQPLICKCKHSLLIHLKQSVLIQQTGEVLRLQGQKGLQLVKSDRAGLVIGCNDFGQAAVGALEGVELGIQG